MPDRPGWFRDTASHGFRNIYDLFIRSGTKLALCLGSENHPALSRNEAILTPVVPALSTILASLGQAAFVWHVATDEIVWSDQVASVFPDIPTTALASGAGFSNLIEPVRSVRTDALGHSPPSHDADGVPYRIEYGVRASTSAPVQWIEESGCWFAGADGKPARVQGIVRVNNERHAREEQLLKLSRHDPLDRRTQPHPPHRIAGRNHRGSRRASAPPARSC